MRFLILCFLICCRLTAFAQHPYAGEWNGAIEIPGTKLEIAIDLREDQGKWTGDLDIPVQRIKDMALAALQIARKDISFTLPEVPGNARFKGTFDEKSEKITGTFSQAGQSFPMNLAKAAAAEKEAAEKRLSAAAETLRHLIDSLRLQRHMPGLAVGIIKDGKVILQDGFGYRDVAQKLPVTVNTQFAIGSSTKAFTAAAVGILADRGLLDWEKPVIQYMPDFKLHDPFATREMTPIDLLCHRSGLPRHDLMWYGAPFSRTEIYQRLAYLQPNKSFRTTFQYNNLMFLTAGVLVERLSGKSWEQFIQDEIFNPLGMRQANCSIKTLAAHAEPALGYQVKNKKPVFMPYRNLDAIGPAGSINADVQDMLKWVSLHLNSGKVEGREIISEAGLAAMHAPQMLMPDEGMASTNGELYAPAYGLGWMIYRHKGIKIVEHGGNIDGFSALVYMAPEKDLGIVILSNQNASALPGILARYATDLLLDLPYSDWYSRGYGAGDEEPKEEKEMPEPKQIKGTKAGHALADYAGEFENPGYGPAVVSLAGSELSLQFHDFSMPMTHWHYDVFMAKEEMLDAAFLINFQTDAQGVVYAFSVSLDPLVPEIEFKRTPPKRLSDPVFLQKLTGQYRLEQIEQTFKVELRGNKLIATVPGQAPYELIPFTGTSFKLKDLNGFTLEFHLDDKGQVKSATMNQPNGALEARKE